MKIKKEVFDYFGGKSVEGQMNDFISENNIVKSDVITITYTTYGIELWYWGE